MLISPVLVTLSDALTDKVADYLSISIQDMWESVVIGEINWHKSFRDCLFEWREVYNTFYKNFCSQYSYVTGVIGVHMYVLYFYISDATRSSHTFE